MFNIYRSSLKSRQITGLMTSCADLWYLTCVHTVRFKQAQRMEELLPWPGCSPGVFSAGCSCPLGMFKTLLEGSRYAPMDHGPHSSPLTGRISSLLPVPPALLAVFTPKTTGIPLAEHWTCRKRGKASSMALIPWFYLSGKEHIRWFSRSLQWFPVMFKNCTGKRKLAGIIELSWVKGEIKKKP